MGLLRFYIQHPSGMASNSTEYNLKKKKNSKSAYNVLVFVKFITFDLLSLQNKLENKFFGNVESIIMEYSFKTTTKSKASYPVTTLKKILAIMCSFIHLLTHLFI